MEEGGKEIEIEILVVVVREEILVVREEEISHGEHCKINKITNISLTFL